MIRKITVVLMAGLAGMFAIPAEKAMACERSLWVNEQAQTGDIARITLEEDCPNYHKVRRRIKIETRCTPRLCTWGWDMLFKHGLQDFTAVFQTYSATRYVSISLNHDIMRLEVENDYAHPGQATDFRKITLYRQK
jgi:hypothetical protein